MNKYVYVIYVYYEITSYEEELEDVIVSENKELAEKIADSKNRQKYTRAVVKRKQLLSWPLFSRTTLEPTHNLFLSFYE